MPKTKRSSGLLAQDRVARNSPSVLLGRLAVEYPEINLDIEILAISQDSAKLLFDLIQQPI